MILAGDILYSTTVFTYSTTVVQISYHCRPHIAPLSSRYSTTVILHMAGAGDGPAARNLHEDIVELLCRYGGLAHSDPISGTQ